MAKIEMDISEYEVLKENKKLLEDSLNKERSLTNQIEILNKEKIKALEDASMKVVKISKTSRQEHLLVRYTNSHKLQDAIEKIKRGYYPVSSLSTDGLNGVYNYLEQFFEKTESISWSEPEITTHGLDEIKKELRDELKLEIDNETQSKIKRSDKIIKEHDEFMRSMDSVKKRNEEYSELTRGLLEKIYSLEKTIEKYKSKKKELLDEQKLEKVNGAIVDDLRIILDKGYGLWNRSTILDKVISLINNKK